jgi:hypothetical protein
MTESHNKNLNKDMNRLLKKWIQYDENIKNLENKLKVLKSKKNKITPVLEEQFQNNQLNKIIINNKFHVAFRNKEYLTPINKKYLSKSLDSLIDDTDKKNKIIEYIYNNRDIIYRKNLLILPN